MSSTFSSPGYVLQYRFVLFDIDAIVMTVINDKMGVTPPLSLHDPEKSHRLGESVPAVDPSSSDFELNEFGITCYRARFT